MTALEEDTGRPVAETGTAAADTISPPAPLPSWTGTAGLWVLGAGLSGLWAAGFLMPPAPDRAQGILALALVAHLPYLAILGFLAFGLVERLCYLRRARRVEAPGRLPGEVPEVCVQLPMFNEDAVAERAIAAAAALRWPAGRLSLLVLDDSTDPDIRYRVRLACARVEARTGVPVAWLHRADRRGYKAGALEAGRHRTSAGFIAIFDADFPPPPDFLERAMPYFFRPDGTSDDGLALVQTQWGHLNDDASALTAAQAMWVDDHHTLQQSWRSQALDFVNFTGTAGIWRAEAIEAAGGWRSASLVEDCELSFRVLFAGYRTRFVKDIVAPAELPQTLAACRLQQKRWTQGWARLQRLHLATLMARFRTGHRRRAMLACMMCIGWQWPLWTLWISLFPVLNASGLWAGVLGVPVAILVYLAPPLGFALFAAVLATLEARATYAGRAGRAGLSRLWRLGRILPYLAINAGMLPHHLCAFLEGLLGPMHAEFERTPKTAAISQAVAPAVPGAGETGKAPEPATAARARGAAPDRRRWLRRVYLLVEAVVVATQCAWTLRFLVEGNALAALGSGAVLACILGLRLAALLPAAARAT